MKRDTPLKELTEIRAELLTDSIGPYGIKVTNPEPGPEWEDINFLARPDKMRDSSEFDYAVMQQIPVNLLRSFKRSAEGRIATALLTAMLARKGWTVEQDGTGTRWWASDEKEQAKNRGAYHALKAKSVAITNSLLRPVLAAVPQQALMAARRFKPGARMAIWGRISSCQRHMQLCETFPIALMSSCIGETEYRRESANLIHDGVPLKVLADFVNRPMWMRNVLPGAHSEASYLGKVLHDYGGKAHPRIERLAYDYLPKTTAAQKLWLRAVADSLEYTDGPYVEWIIKNAASLGNTFDQVRAGTADIA